jgi:hypothetical protein
MRRIRSILGLVAVATLAGSSAALAVTACDRPPPAWYTAPRLTHTYSESWGSGYARASTHEYSAQRRSYSSQPRYYTAPPRQRVYYTTRSPSFREPFWRW